MAIPIRTVTEKTLDTWLKQASVQAKQWVATVGFKAKPESICLVPDAQGGLAEVLFGVNEDLNTWNFGLLPKKLPQGEYCLAIDLSKDALFHACLAWQLGCYQFDRYSEVKLIEAELQLPDGIDRALLEAHVEATHLIRDLINTSPQDMGPAELTAVGMDLAKRYGAKANIIEGDALLEENYPAIHAVGRGSDRAPRLLRMQWGNPKHPRVALVGKGVCFDTGGLSIKNNAGMRTMSKDMGGAAHVLGLAQLIMATELPVYLDVLVPAVENAIGRNAYRPSDVLQTRKGLTVEIGNTDAEGRLILADALYEAAQAKPDLMIDFATLTGAARVALGPDLPALFTDDQDLADVILKTGRGAQDPFWQLPLHKPYKKFLDSKHADLCNISSTPYGGAITAALFLSAFVPEEISWAHIDLMAFNTRDLAGRPQGGAAMGLRTTYKVLKERYLG